MSMRIRILLSFILVVFLTITIVILVARQSAIREVRTFMLRGTMTDINVLLGDLVDYYRQNKSWEGAEKLVLPQGHMRGQGQGNSGNMMGQRFLISDSNGVIQVDTQNTRTGTQLDKTELASGMKINDGLNRIGYLIVEGGTGLNQADSQQLIERLNRAALAAALIAGFASLVLALFLAYRLISPVKELTEAAEKLGEGDLSQRVPIHGKDELASLGRTFNKMADSLQTSEKARKAMTADIAHELRNPLAVQRASLEAMQDGIYPMTNENLTPVIEQNILLTRLVEDLRTLALVDANQLDFDLTQFDLPGLCRKIINLYQAEADRRSISIRLTPDPGQSRKQVQVYADPVRVEQIISNILTNALRYTPESGEIVLEIQKTGVNLVSTTIHDSGPGIPSETIPYVFDRFYRVDRARSRQDGGTGLGLAIARQLSEAQGGRLSAANHPDGGAVFTLILPTTRPENV